ncbi:MAG: CPBP family intramembrane glutamic endopeptidase [Caulobacterales bacterium]
MTQTGYARSIRRFAEVAAVAALLGGGIPWLAVVAANLLVASGVTPPQGTWQWVYWQHGIQCALALIAMAIIRRFVAADFGLRWPPGKSYIGPALLWGLGFGLAVDALAAIPLILSHAKPSLGYPLTPTNITGWLTFQGLFVGPTEEIPFRGLLIGYLATAVPGRMRILRVDLPQAGVIAAVIFMLGHWGYGSAPWWAALFQQVYALTLGLFYAFWFDRSRSVVAPIVAHNAADFIAVAAYMVWDLA